MNPGPPACAGRDYAECITATGVRGGVARNVVPGEAEIDVNYRYPPGMDPAEAEAWKAEQDQLAAKGDFYFACLQICFGARKPGPPLATQ